MTDKKFNPLNKNKLHNPERLKFTPPEVMIKALGLENPENLVDYGAGTGFFTYYFAEKYPNARLFALDIEPLMIEEMENTMDCKNLFPIEISDNEMPFGENSIDAVWSIAVHHELPTPNVWLANVYKTLKPGGKLLIVDWSVNQDPKYSAGPPLDHRIDDKEIVKSLESLNFSDITYVDGLMNNFGILATK